MVGSGTDRRVILRKRRLVGNIPVDFAVIFGISLIGFVDVLGIIVGLIIVGLDLFELIIAIAQILFVFPFEFIVTGFRNGVVLTVIVVVFVLRVGVVLAVIVVVFVLRVGVALPSSS